MRIAVYLGVCGVLSAVVCAQTALTPEQIEADWLRQEQVRWTQGTGGQVGREDDAAGGVDGVRDGTWGFHTANEAQPWWRVDLGELVPIDRVVLYNRTELAERNSRIIVSLSDDGRTFRHVYQHDGTVFYGHSDGKPLIVKLNGQKGRYVHAGLGGTSYFHLDEVEVYASGRDENIALHKPATQSSTSQWSRSHATGQRLRVRDAVERGLRLAADLEAMGVDVSNGLRRLEAVRRRISSQGTESADSEKSLYLEARWAIRRMALMNPLLDFEKILFVKRVPPAFPHMSDQYYGWWSRGGGGIYVLEGFKSDSPSVRCLTEGFAEGSFLRPDVSFDGGKVVFAYCRFYAETHQMQKVDKSALPRDVFYNIYEMNIDGGGLRRLTDGKYDDFDSRYLPDGDVVFLSTRKGQAVQVARASTAATMRAAMPDSYVRCGGDNWRPVPVFTLHRMRPDGSDIRPISAFENFEWTPSLAADGRILYARWDYIDRFNGPFISLWSANQDGTNPQLVYGNYTSKPQCVFEARSIPGSHKLVFTAAPHHSNMGGSLVLLDRTRGTEFEQPLTRLTPDVCFPETEGWPAHYYSNPYPLSEAYFLVTWSDKPLPPHSFVTTDDRNPPNPQGIYLYDAFGNLEMLYRDARISSMYPLPLKARPRPPAHPEMVDWDGAQEGRFLVQDVYRGLPGVPRGTVKRLRVVGVPPKVQPHMNQPSIGVSQEDPGKFVIGTAPMEADGSAYFHVPSGVSVFFQVLDEQGMAIQTMRSLTYVQPGQTLSCVGCHESRESAPAVGPVAAARKEPSKLKPGPSGSWPLRFDELIQPLLNDSCVGCHHAGGGDAAAKLILTADKAYANLMAFADRDLHKLAFEKDASVPGDCVARKSRLLAVLRDGAAHRDVHLDAEAFERLVTWLDVYAQRLGSFSEQQEQELRRLRQSLAAVLAE